MLCLSEGGVSTYTTVNSSVQEICIFSHLFIQPFTYGLMAIYIILWIITQPYGIYFVAQISPALAISFGSCIPLPRHHFAFRVFSYFLPLRDALGLSCMYPTPAIAQPFLQGALVPCIGEWC